MALNMATMALGIAATLPNGVSSGRAVTGPTLSRYGMASAQIGCRLSSSFSSMGIAPTMRRSLSALVLLPKTEQKINGIISEYTKEDISPKDKDRGLVGDLPMDSLDLVDLTMSLEDELNVEINTNEFRELTTVQSLYDLIERKGIK